MPDKETPRLYRYRRNDHAQGLRPSVLKSLIEQGRPPVLDGFDEFT